MDAGCRTHDAIKIRRSRLNLSDLMFFLNEVRHPLIRYPFIHLTVENPIKRFMIRFKRRQIIMPSSLDRN